MEPVEGKRRYERVEYSSPMNLYRMDYQDQPYYAEMKDYSQGGLSMLTNEKLVIGQLVYLEMKKYDEHAAGPEKRKSYSGSVRWASPYSSPHDDSKSVYKYGIEYHEPVGYLC